MKYTIELTENQKKQMDFMLDMANKHMGFNRKLEMIETTNVEDTNEYQIGYKTGYEKGKKCLSDSELERIWETKLAQAKEDGYNRGIRDSQDALYTQENLKEEYERGLEDVDHAIEVIKAMTGKECANWFEDCVGLDAVICGFTIPRIIEIVKAYEEMKKAEEEIIKGDTVCFKSSPNITFIVWDILDEADEGIFVYGFNQNGTYSSVNIKNVKKVNVPNCYSEVSQLLDKLRGEGEQ